MSSARLLPALLLLTTIGCAANPVADAAATSAPPATSLAADLRAAGLTVEDAGTVEQPFFGVPASVFRVDGNDVQVYEFDSAAAAEKAAADVAPNGGSIGTAMMSWMAPPHFFRKDRLIVNYLGTSEKTLAALRNLLGPQFAGR